jgi:gliding motility-associated protein GldM
MAGGNCPETPRQKMIGMMYLFYTALLALNVSGEVINAFVKIDDSIQKTTASFSSKTLILYNNITRKALEQPEKYSNLSKQADEIRKSSQILFDYIDELKLTIIQKVEGSEATLNGEINKKDDTNGANEIMIGLDKGRELQNEVEKYRNMLLNIIDDESKPVHEHVLKTLNTDDQLQGEENKLFWRESFSKAMPLIGTIALLSKLQADVRNSEADVLEYMISDLEGVDIRITSLEGLVNAPKSFIVKGGEYTSSVFLGARDTTMRPIVYLTYDYPFYDSVVEDGKLKYIQRAGAKYDSLPLDASGKGLHKMQANSVGNFTYGGLVNYKSNRGDLWLPYEASYQVGDAGFTVSATKCNVLYRGLDNPVEVVASAYPREDVSATISEGTMTKVQSGGYIVKIPQSVTSRQVTITVSVKTDAGVKILGTENYNVLNVPPPTIRVANYSDGQRVPKVAITQNPRLTATLESDFFPFDGINYSVTRYEFIYTARDVPYTIPVEGSALTTEIINHINRMGPGSQITFMNIFCAGPSGVRQAGGINVILR